MCFSKKICEELVYEELSDEEDLNEEEVDEDVRTISEKRYLIMQYLNWFLGEDWQLSEKEIEDLCDHKLKAVRNEAFDFVTGQSNFGHSEVVEEIILGILSAKIQQHCWKALS